MNGIKNCYICESSSVKIDKKINDFQIYKCKECGLRWIDDIDVNKIPFFYNKNYFTSSSIIGYKDYLFNEENLRRDAKNVLNIINKVKDPTELRILDVGCAFGFLLDEAKRLKSCDVYGVELSRYACEYGKSKLGLKIINQELDSSCFDHDFFDIVSLIATIEHLADPKATLDIVNKILKPKGLLVITTINTAGPLPLYSLKPPEHFFYFNHYNLSILLDNLGFKILLKEIHFENYYLYDLFYRLGKFLSLSIFGSISEIIKRGLPNFSVKIPTNNMIIIAEKENIENKKRQSGRAD